MSGRGFRGHRKVRRTVPKMRDLHTGIFTDGSCPQNPGLGGWGWVHVVNNRIIDSDSGAQPATTNNRMELWAIYAALLALSPDTAATIYSDSQLAVNTVSVWARGWSRQPWFTENGTERKNLDIVVPLYRLSLARPRVIYRWVRGHAGIYWNEYADGLAGGRRQPSPRIQREAGGMSSLGSVAAEVPRP